MAKTDWEKIWADQAINVAEDRARLSQELSTLRWALMAEKIKQHLGEISGTNVIEVGAGVGDFSIILNGLGAKTTLADYSPEAIEKAKQRFKAHGLTANYALADMLKVPKELCNKYEISFSLGLGEHFDGQHRADIIAAHAHVLRPGGLTFISVPYRYSPAYRIWMRSMIKHDSWAYGLEIPFSKREIRRLGEQAGLETLGFIQSSFFADWDRFFPSHHVRRVFGRKIERRSVFNNLGYALVYVGKKP